MAKIMNLLLWQQCKVHLTGIYVSQIMSILYWTVDISKDLEMSWRVKFVYLFEKELGKKTNKINT